jgi:hypothetical protein
MGIELKSFILDAQGVNVAHIKNGEVFSNETKEKIGTLRDGDFIDLDGKLVCSLIPADAFPGGDIVASDAFMRALQRR